MSVFIGIRSMLCRCFLFFFKQQTAYDMRISDWSSDVCSSDLLDDYQRTVYLAIVVTSVTATALLVAPVSVHRALFRKQMKSSIVTLAARITRVALGVHIGRASCRERLMQYALVSVFAVSLHTQH